MKNRKKIYLIGDINCQYYKLMMKIDLRKIKNAHIIVLGNFGIGTLSKSIEEKNLEKVNKFLIKNNINIYLLRGDIDNIEKFKKYKYKYSNIIFTEDYDVLKIENINFLFVGGSISFNRIYNFDIKRKKPVLFKEFDLKNKDVDIVLSHDNVDFIYPYNFHNLKPFTKNDKWLYNDIKKKRKKLTSVYDELKKRKNNIKYWYSSKYDNDNYEKKDNTIFKQLKKLEMIEFK